MPARSELVSYQEKLEQERLVYARVEKVHELPPIFHYWSERHLRPHLESFAFSSPEDMFHSQALDLLRDHPHRPLHTLSIGAGNCDLEVDLLARLRAAGASQLRCDCLEWNPDMIERGRRAAAAQNLEASFRFLQADFNEWRSDGACYHLILANQSLHHVLALEHLLSELRQSLAPDGRLLVSDMIGRNGHRRWPAALAVIWEFWRELPPAYRYNHLYGTYEEFYVDRDCSQIGFEGIRSQDILPLLLRYFHFELFLPFGNLIDPFIDRAFGPNFNPASPWDRDFIDRLHARDEAGIRQGEWPPTHLLAVLRRSPPPALLLRQGLTPQQCLPPSLAATQPATMALPSPPEHPYLHPPSAEDATALLSLCHRVSTNLEASRAHARQLASQHTERTEWALRLEAELHEERALRERLQAETASLQAWGARLDQEIEAKDAALAQLQQEFAERTEWALRLDAELQRAYRWGEDLGRDLRSLQWADICTRKFPRLTACLKSWCSAD